MSRLNGSSMLPRPAPVRWALSLWSFVLAACGPPPDRQLTRPHAVPATPYEQHDIRLEGLRLRYIDVGPLDTAGDGGTLLLIHGHTSRIEEYDGLIPTLARRHRVLVPDLPGSGYSDKPAREYTLAFYEDTLMAFLDQLGVVRAHLAGGSLGGNLVLRLAHRFPQRFDRLVPWAPGSAWEASPRVAAVIRTLSSYAVFWPMVKIQSRYWYSEDWPKKDATLRTTFTYYEEVMGPGFVRMYFGMAADQVERSLFGLAPEIRHPVLLAWGDRDNGANMGEGVKRLHELLPHSELLVFKGARHSLASEIPEPLSGAIDQFLARPERELP
jgi:2-hydroxy-6-oxonona-2,4-dienedioate hydrolase